jgi:hypothetical protein
MVNYSIRTEWYNDIKDLTPTANPYFITEGDYAGQVEVDILNVEQFEEVSRQLGWML